MNFWFRLCLLLAAIGQCSPLVHAETPGQENPGSIRLTLLPVVPAVVGRECNIYFDKKIVVASKSMQCVQKHSLAMIPEVVNTRRETKRKAQIGGEIGSVDRFVSAGHFVESNKMAGREVDRRGTIGERNARLV